MERVRIEDRKDDDGAGGLAGVTRREVLWGLAGAGVALGLDGLGFGEAAEKPAQLVYSAYGGDYGEQLKQVYGAAFKQRTGISLAHDVGTNPDRLTKLRLQRSSPKTDVTVLMDRFLIQATNEGLLEPYDRSHAKNLKDIYPFFVHDTWVGYAYMPVGIVYNTAKVSKPIRSWKDIFDPQFAGRVFIDDISHFGLHLLVAFARMAGGGEANIDPGFKEMARLKAIVRPRIVTTSQEGEKLFQTGETWIAAWQKARALWLGNQGLPIRYVSPAEGEIGVTWGHAVVKGTRYKEFVEQYIDVTLDADLQVAFAKAKVPNSPTNRKARLSGNLQDANINEEELNRALQLDWARILPQLDQWVERWNKEIAAKG